MIDPFLLGSSGVLPILEDGFQQERGTQAATIQKSPLDVQGSIPEETLFSLFACDVAGDHLHRSQGTWTVLEGKPSGKRQYRNQQMPIWLGRMHIPLPSFEESEGMPRHSRLRLTLGDSSAPRSMLHWRGKSVLGRVHILRSRSQNMR